MRFSVHFDVSYFVNNSNERSHGSTLALPSGRIIHRSEETIKKLVDHTSAQYKVQSLPQCCGVCIVPHDNWAEH